MRESKPKILIIEDQEDDEVFLRNALKAAGAPEPWKVCRTGDSAREVLEKLNADDSPNGDPPDLIFLDLHLPGISGLDLLRWLRRQVAFEKVIVILLTGSREDFTLQSAHDLGANTYLSKPPSADSVRVILTALDRFNHDFEAGSMESPKEN